MSFKKIIKIPMHCSSQSSELSRDFNGLMFHSWCTNGQTYRLRLLSSFALEYDFPLIYKNAKVFCWNVTHFSLSLNPVTNFPIERSGKHLKRKGKRIGTNKWMLRASRKWNDGVFIYILSYISFIRNILFLRTTVLLKLLLFIAPCCLYSYYYIQTISFVVFFR